MLGFGEVRLESLEFVSRQRRHFGVVAVGYSHEIFAFGARPGEPVGCLGHRFQLSVFLAKPDDLDRLVGRTHARFDLTKAV
jgi:hypothetical protein